MSISVMDLFQYAEKVLSTSSCESGYRNSIGRAYYSAMHHCRELQSNVPERSGSSKSRLGSHARLINKLLSPTTQDPGLREKSIKIGLDLQAMKTIRNVADYDLGKHVTKMDAEDMVERAKIIFEDV